MTRRRPPAVLLGLGLTAWGAMLASAHAQDVDGRATPAPLRLSTSASLTETLTDNRRLTRDAQADAITDARANVHALLNSARVRGFFDYGLSGLVHARESSLNDVRHALATAVTSELVERRGFVDVRGSVQQNSRSAFGTQSVSRTRGDANRVETASGSVSPYWRGRIGRLADVEARYSLAATRSRGTDAGENTTRTGLLNVGRDFGRSSMWSLQALHQNVDYTLGRDTVLQRVEGTLGTALHPDLFTALTAGSESTDLATIQRKRRATYGLQARWTPSERTQAQAMVRRSFFGNAHAVSVTHRTPRTAWSFNATRDLSSGQGQAVVRLGSAYELLFQQFASIEPDPLRRDVIVRNFLALRGIDPELDVRLGLLVSAVTLRSDRSLAFALVGRRVTVTMLLSRDETTRLSSLDNAPALGDLLSDSRVRQNGVSLNVSHRLTSTVALDLAAAWKRTQGDTTRTETTLKSALLTWSNQLSARSTVSLSLRHAEFESTTNPYDENAVLATLSRRF